MNNDKNLNVIVLGQMRTGSTSVLTLVSKAHECKNFAEYLHHFNPNAVSVPKEVKLSLTSPKDFLDHWIKDKGNCVKLFPEYLLKNNHSAMINSSGYFSTSEEYAEYIRIVFQHTDLVYLLKRKNIVSNILSLYAFKHHSNGNIRHPLRNKGYVCKIKRPKLLNNCTFQHLISDAATNWFVEKMEKLYSSNGLRIIPIYSENIEDFFRPKIREDNPRLKPYQQVEYINEINDMELSDLIHSLIPENKKEVEKVFARMKLPVKFSEIENG